MRNRVFKIRPTGIPRDSRAPFWRGERAEDIIAKRLKEYNKKKRLAELKRRRKRKAKK